MRLRWIGSSLFESMAEIYFTNWPLGISILKPHFPLRKTSRVEDLMTRRLGYPKTSTSSKS
jgi:hypothetical protein